MPRLPHLNKTIVLWFFPCAYPPELPLSTANYWYIHLTYTRLLDQLPGEQETRRHRRPQCVAGAFSEHATGGEENGRAHDGSAG